MLRSPWGSAAKTGAGWYLRWVYPECSPHRVTWRWPGYGDVEVTVSDQDELDAMTALTVKVISFVVDLASCQSGCVLGNQHEGVFYTREAAWRAALDYWRRQAAVATATCQHYSANLQQEACGDVCEVPNEL